MVCIQQEQKSFKKISSCPSNQLKVISKKRLLKKEKWKVQLLENLSNRKEEQVMHRIHAVFNKLELLSNTALQI